LDVVDKYITYKFKYKYLFKYLYIKKLPEEQPEHEKRIKQRLEHCQQILWNTPDDTPQYLLGWQHSQPNLQHTASL
jgi:hypothetical protein